MATKPSNSDGFANPLYDKLLQYCDRKAAVLFPERWDYSWTRQDIEDAVRTWDRDPDAFDPPYRPRPEVAYINWQRTLQAKADHRSDPRGYKLVDAGIVDLVVGMDFPILDYDCDSDQLVVSRSTTRIELLYLCRPVLKSVAKTLRELNAMRDRRREYSRPKEILGVITANLDTHTTDPIRGQNYDCVVIGPDELM
jgi:hypothetical protein